MQCFCCVFSEREMNVHVRCMSSSVRLSSVTNALLRPWPSIDLQVKFYGDRPRGTPPWRELNARGVTEYSDSGHIEGYISETVKDR